MSSKITASALYKEFSGSPALGPLDIEVREGEFLCVLGPSGCGKTTLLRLLASLEKPTAGTCARRPSSPRLFAAMVFQDLALFPWKTVYENVSLGLRLRRVPEAEARERTMTAIKNARLLGCEGRLPRELSGGMRQRVALARAFASDPELLLLDEPLGSVDASTRWLLQEELLSLCEKPRKTAVLVTHSIEEAVLLADRLLVLTARPGRVKAEIEVPFPRPRSRGILADPRFVELERRIWGLLEEEVREAMDRSESTSP